jgi:pSer/pThr/pTyr-binding forkhead associated (FHA) protein
LTKFNEPDQPDDTRYWLTIRQGGRHIMLPPEGELVLGRYDPNFGIPPDVDLTYEDGPAGVISRRHARITGKEGRYTIQEMGGRLGVFVNGQQIPLGVAYQLKTGDRVLLGNCEMFYDKVPNWVTAPAKLDGATHFFMMSGTGRRLVISAGADMVVGRSDKYVSFTPDIDLAVLGDKAAKVSRRHARLFFKPGNPALYVEDMGSGFGTKINGELIMLGESRALTPGDHIWLGGCVLAYDIMLR